MLSLRLPKDIEERLDGLAKRTGRTKTFYVRQAIMTHLEDLEDAFQADEIMKRVRTGEESVLSAEEMRKSLGLES
jgi:RHH-type rel operon transcriptional repressor/antitoxin RelB